VVKVSRAFRLLSRAGRREWRAQRWDARADRAAERRAFWVGQWQGLDYMMRGDQAEEARVSAMEFHNLETLARQQAREIREGR
jgi:hypothetical protein